jgi:hypothetical protein
MRTSQSDYIIRLIEQLGAMLARLRGRLAGGSPEAAQEVLDETRQAQAELFGPLWEVISRVDSHTAVSLIHEPSTIDSWIALLQLEREAARVGGNESSAEGANRRLIELHGELDRLRAHDPDR